MRHSSWKHVQKLLSKWSLHCTLGLAVCAFKFIQICCILSSLSSSLFNFIIQVHYYYPCLVGLQAESGVNRYAQALVLAQFMQQIEEADMLAGLESSATPSWIRGHFRFEC